MSYCPHYLYDLFISYACADDKAHGIVSRLHASLIDLLGANGVPGARIFFDKRSIESGSDLTDQVLTAARSSAVMVCIHSPAWDLSKDWCNREFSEFWDVATSKEGRLFIVALKGDALPTASPVLADTARHFRSLFYQQGGRSFVFNEEKTTATNSEGFTFDEETQILCQEIVTTLHRERGRSPAPRAFITCCSGPMSGHARDIKNWLADEGFIVFQTSAFVANAERRLADASEGIEASQIIISIVEEEARMDAATRQHRQEQLELAAHARKPILSWLPQADHGLNETRLVEMRQQPGVIAEPLGRFKQLCAEALRPPPTVATTPSVGYISPLPGSELDVLFLCAPPDHAGGLVGFQTSVQQVLDRLNVDVFSDASDFAGDEQQADWHKALKLRLERHKVKRLIFVDGACNADWIDTRLRNYHVLSRDLAPAPRGGVCLLAPLPKAPPRACRLPRMLTYFREDELEKFTEFVTAS